MSRAALLLQVLGAGLAVVDARQTCLNAEDFGFTPKDSLRNSSFAGEEFVLTIAAGKWDSSGIGANLIKILAEDLLGIRTNVKNHGTFSSEASLQIVAGLEMKTLLSENETFRELPVAQLTMDVWQTNSRGTWNWLMNRGEFRRVLNMGRRVQPSGRHPHVPVCIRVGLERAEACAGLLQDLHLQARGGGPVLQQRV
jgi:hypothetical protein